MFCIPLPEFNIFSIPPFPHTLSKDGSSGGCGYYKVDGRSYSEAIFELQEDGVVPGFFQKIAILFSNVIAYLVSGVAKWSVAQVEARYVYVKQQEFDRKRAANDPEIIKNSHKGFEKKSIHKLEVPVGQEEGEVEIRMSQGNLPNILDQGSEASPESLQMQRKKDFIKNQWASVKKTNEPLYLSKKSLAAHWPSSSSYFLTGEFIFENSKTSDSSQAKGASKRCKRSENMLTRERVARLVPLAKRGIDRTNQFNRLNLECNFLEKLKGCRGIVQMLACDRGRINAQGQEKLALYLKFYSMGELFSYVQYGCHLDDVQKNKVAEDLMEGLAAMHERRITHGDIKPQNILIHGEGQNIEAVFCDFDLAIEEDSSDFTRISGSPAWSSPEKMHAAGQAYRYFDFEANKRADMWSFGLILYLLFFHGFPTHLDPNQTRDRKSLLHWLRSHYDQPGSFFPEPQEKSSKKHLIWEMLQFKSFLRPHIKAVRQRWNDCS